MTYFKADNDFYKNGEITVTKEFIRIYVDGPTTSGFLVFGEGYVDFIPCKKKSLQRAVHPEEPVVCTIKNLTAAIRAVHGQV